MSFVPRCFIFPVFSVLALVGCHRAPTQEEISARAAELVAEQLASKQAGTEEPAVELSEADKELLEKTNAALDEIIIPRVEFRDVTLREAVTFLQQRAIEITRELPDRVRILPAFYIKYEFAPQYLGPGESPAGPSKSPVVQSPEPSGRQQVKAEFAPQYLRVNENPVVQPLEPSESQVITMDLSNLPLREALQYCAQLSNVEMKVQPGVVLFEPIN
jgi:hypothetical protein